MTTTHTFAEIDAHTGNLRVVERGVAALHVVVDDLGAVQSRRGASATLRAAGWNPVGAWRTSTEGDDIRTLTSSRP